MNFREFRQAVKEFANGEYYSVKVEVSQHRGEYGGEIEIEWSAYTGSLGWYKGAIPEEALMKLKGEVKDDRFPATEADVAAIGEVP